MRRSVSRGSSRGALILACLLVVSLGLNVGLWFLRYRQGSVEGYEEGYVQGLEDGAGSSYTVRDPTYSEAMAFVNFDDTDTLEYSDDFDCTRFAARFMENAIEMGFRCYYVHVYFEGSKGHAIVAFETVDRGTIFIEPQHDLEVQLTAGMSYCELNNLEGTASDIIVDHLLIP